MATDDERRRVAAAFRRYSKETTNRKFCSIFDVLDACGLSYYDGAVLYDRLADLIDPCDMSQDCRDNVAREPTERGIDSIYEWCFEGLEGADGAEDYLYCSIMSAVEEYRHPERVTARTARPVDREELLALADEMANVRRWSCYTDSDLLDIAERIREACGEVES